MTGFEIAAIAAMAAAGGASAYQTSRANESISNFNRDQAEVDAINERAWSKYDADLQRKAGEAERGRTRALAGASGIDVGDGGIIDVLSDDAVENELAALDIEFRGEAAARSSNSRADLARLQGSTARSGRVLSVLGGGMQGGAQGASISGGISRATAGSPVKRATITRTSTGGYTP